MYKYTVFTLYAPFPFIFLYFKSLHLLPLSEQNIFKKNEERLKISAQYCMPVIMAVSGYI